MAERVGKIVEFLDGSRLKIAVVTAQNAGKMQVTDRGGRQHKISEKGVIVVHPVSTTTSEIGSRAEELLAEVESVGAEVDTELLWESAEGSTDELPLALLAETWFGESTPVRQSAVFRAVSEDPVRFRLRGRAVFARKQREVDGQLNAVRNREEREQRRRGSIDWMRETLRAGDHCDVPEEKSRLVRQVEEWIWRPDQRGEELEEWLARAGGDVEADEAAYRLLLLTGRVTEDDDRFLVLAGIREGFSGEVIAASEGLLPYEAESSRVDFTSLVCFSIDDPETREIDDALTVEETTGGTRVGIHIADVAHFVEPGDVLDREAFRRGVTVYLPSRSATMFPERLSCDLASLRSDELRPTMSFIVDFDHDGDIVAERIERGQVRVTHRLDYDGADELMRSDDDDELTRALRRLDGIAETLLDRRRERGALIIHRPELRVRARKDEPIRLEVLLGDSPSRRVVAELMILANSVAATGARRLEVPIIYRTQEPPRAELRIPQHYDPVALDAAFRSLERSKPSTHARAHSALGLGCYTQLSSPIRRFADLVMQRQFAAHLAGEQPPYDTEELLVVLAAVEDVERQARRIEQRANRSTVLEHLADERLEDEFEAVLVRRQGASGEVETTDLYIRGTVIGAADREPGERLDVRIDRVDARRGTLVFRVSS